MRLVALAASLVLVTALTTGAWAAPGDPEPVRVTPRVVEDTPTSHGAWLGWEQGARHDPTHGNYFVRRGTEAPVRVNAAGTEGYSGGIAGHRVYYVQQFHDRRPRMIDLDLRTGDRTPMPAIVNHRRHLEYATCCSGQQHHRSHMLSWVHGDVTASGPWLLYSGYMDDLDHDFPYETVELYDRVDHRVRTLATMPDDEVGLWAGQVNGRYATYWWVGRYGGEKFYRYDIRTGRTVEIPLPDESSWDPAVSSDGTVYYVHAVHSPDGAPTTYDLVRQPIDGPAQVVTTLTDQLAGLFVRDRPNGSRAVFFSWHDDIYRLIDRPPA